MDWTVVLGQTELEWLYDINIKIFTLKPFKINILNRFGPLPQSVGTYLKSL